MYNIFFCIIVQYTIYIMRIISQILQRLCILSNSCCTKLLIIIIFAVLCQIASFLAKMSLSETSMRTVFSREQSVAGSNLTCITFKTKKHEEIYQTKSVNSQRIGYFFSITFCSDRWRKSESIFKCGKTKRDAGRTTGHYLCKGFGNRKSTDQHLSRIQVSEDTWIWSCFYRSIGVQLFTVKSGATGKTL